MDDTPVKNEQQFVFVSYISRSGSTLFCRLLDRYDDISVGIEAGFPGFVSSLFPEQYREINSKEILEKYLDELYRDIRFQQWNVDRDKLFQRLEAEGYPLYFPQILKNCMIEYFGGSETRFFVHKAGYYIDILDEVSSFFPGAKHIYIIRDPRAIYASQKNASCIYTGKSMGHSLVGFLHQYKKRVRILAENVKNRDLIVIRYEDLVNNEEIVEEKVLPFLGLEGVSRGITDYSARIPENQKFLHTNVSSEVNTNSVEKWKNQLEEREISFIQKKLRREMKKYNYTQMECSPSFLFKNVKSELHYGWLQFKRLIRQSIA